MTSYYYVFITAISDEHTSTLCIWTQMYTTNIFTESTHIYDTHIFKLVIYTREYLHSSGVLWFYYSYPGPWLHSYIFFLCAYSSFTHIKILLYILTHSIVKLQFSPDIKNFILLYSSRRKKSSLIAIGMVSRIDWIKSFRVLLNVGHENKICCGPSLTRLLQILHNCVPILHCKEAGLNPHQNRHCARY